MIYLLGCREFIHIFPRLDPASSCHHRQQRGIWENCRIVPDSTSVLLNSVSAAHRNQLSMSVGRGCLCTFARENPLNFPFKARQRPYISATAECRLPALYSNVIRACFAICRYDGMATVGFRARISAGGVLGHGPTATSGPVSPR